MIGGVINILVAIWVYQALIKVRSSNLLWWVAGCAAAFFAVEALTQVFCIEIIDALNGKDVGGEYEPGLTDVGDRKTQESAGGGMFMSVICELFPSIAGFLVVAVVRTQFILKETLVPANLFSGITDMFSSIINSFKTK